MTLLGWKVRTVESVVAEILSGAELAAMYYHGGPEALPLRPALPAITYQRIVRIPTRSHDGSGSFGHSLVQVDVYAAEKNVAETVAEAAIAALSGATAEGITSIQYVSDRQIADRLMRIAIEFEIWHEIPLSAAA